MAVAEVFVRKTTLLRTKKQSNTAAGKLLAKKTGCLIETAGRVLQLTLSNGGGSDNECAIGDGFRDGFEFCGLREKRLGADSGTRFAKSQLIRIDNAKVEEAEIAHGASGCADASAHPTAKANRLALRNDLRMIARMTHSRSIRGSHTP